MFKIIHYRNKCIGCGICYELQPQFWRMSKKDGKAVLLNATVKNDLHILPLPVNEKEFTGQVSNACPARVIKIM
ncbi:ferredoxin [Flavisolibacter ginsengisoli]|uniref:ferredoxin n=1 Tax=Flavisolibacter ginsengisoli TaxID=462367 RepID=UPI000932B3BA|nr:ferredoxin [Flavisolibacter ginsengisoli]